MHVRGALNFLDQRRQRMAAHVAEQARFAEVESKSPLPPASPLAPEPVRTGTSEAAKA